jgi:hypothetical protein
MVALLCIVHSNSIVNHRDGSGLPHYKDVPKAFGGSGILLE